MIVSEKITSKYIKFLFKKIFNLIKKEFISSDKKRSSGNYYEWANRTNFLLAVIYGSARRRSIGSKTFKKSEKIEIKFNVHFRTS